MNGGAQGREGSVAIGPAKDVVSAGGFSTTAFNDRKAGEQAPVQVMGICFCYKNVCYGN